MCQSESDPACEHRGLLSQIGRGYWLCESVASWRVSLGRTQGGGDCLHRRSVSSKACALADCIGFQLLTASCEALKDDPKYIKALQRRATANEQINSWSSLSSAQEGQFVRLYLLLTACHRAHDDRLQEIARIASVCVARHRQHEAVTGSFGIASGSGSETRDC